MEKGYCVSTYYGYRKGFIQNRGKILFNYREGTLHIDVVNLQLVDAQTKKWKDTYPDPLFPTEAKIKSQIAEGIRLVMADETKKQEVMKAFPHNYYFHEVFFSNSTQLAGEIWFDKYLKEQQVSWTFPLADIQKSDKDGFAYKETYHGYLKEKPLKVVRYTQSDTNVFTNKESKVSFKGTCKEASLGDGGWTVVIEE